MTAEQLKTHTIAAWREIKFQQSGTDSSGRTYPWRFVDVSAPQQLYEKKIVYLNFFPILYIFKVVVILEFG